MKWRYSIIILLVILLSACNPASKTPPSTPSAAPQGTPAAAQVTPEKPTPIARTTHTPDPKAAAEAFLAFWAKMDYPGMYAALSSASQSAVAQDAFTKTYQQFAQKLTLQKLDAQVYDGQWDSQSAKMAFNVTYHTALFKDVQRQNTLEMVMENGAWKVKWEDGLPMPDLRGGKQLSLDLTVPERGEIQDRSGYTMAGQSKATALGIIPGQLGEGATDSLLPLLFSLTWKPGWLVNQEIDNSGADWYIPVGEVAEDDMGNNASVLDSYSGLQKFPFGPTRFYRWNGVAPHVTGYTSQIYAEQADEYLRMGYRIDERVGVSGLEAWGQDILSGVRGAILDVVDADGQTLSRLAQVAEEPGQNIVTTIDMDLQLQAQTAMWSAAKYRGAAVVLERDTGRVLALVSSPEFDPNCFNTENYNSLTGGCLERITSSIATPLINRATGGQASGYPLGSVYKIIDMAAALESGLFTPESTYDCQYYFTEIIGRKYEDWTLKKEYPPSGMLTLPQGLMRSCNPWFYHIGLTMYKEGHEKDIADMARGFGLGSKTGIEVLPEIAGNVPEPENEVQAVEQAIGQDTLTVTPLQVADFIAALGNGGTLYRPQLIEKYVKPDGTETQVFKPEERGKLPIKPETLDVIRQAMRSVVANKLGTASEVFPGFNIPVYGKTGTAQLDYSEPFAWFAAFTDAGNKDKPDIAVVVVCENTGEGSEVAAPIARRIMESYFYGRPVKLLPWEKKINRPLEPTPTPGPEGETPTETPQP